MLGGELAPCSMDPLTGFYRNGCCETGPHDLGLHTVCVEAKCPNLNECWGEGTATCCATVCPTTE